jgi:hypothetical protein
VQESVEVFSPSREENGAAVPEPEVQKALAAIRQSVPFRSSKQIQMLLEFLVGETLAGNAETLKERVIGAKLFGRSPNYDTNSDPIVRLRVAELRKRLALYYQTTNEENVRISIPLGAFRAVFEWPRTGVAPSATMPTREEKPEQSSLPPISQSPPGHIGVTDRVISSARSRSRRKWIAIAVSAVILGFVAQHYIPSFTERTLDQFWSPVLSSDTTLIYVGNNPVYEPSPSFVARYFQEHPQNPNEETGANTFIPAPPQVTDPANDLNPAKDMYVTNGDVSATSKIVSLLARKGKQVDIRYGNDVTYGDVRSHPTVLIGAHNNYWTLRTTKNLRIGFEGFDTIIDRSDPQKKWVASEDRSEDYALVSRVMNGWDGKVVVVVAGLGQGATRAAAEFVTSPQSIAKLAKSLPIGWKSKNIQFVLHTTVKNQIPSTPDVVAVYCW